MESFDLLFECFDGVIFILKELLFGIKSDLEIFEFGLKVFVEFLELGLGLIVGLESRVGFSEILELILELIFFVGEFGYFLLDIVGLLGLSVLELVELPLGEFLLFVSGGKLVFEFDDNLLELLHQRVQLLVLVQSRF